MLSSPRHRRLTETVKMKMFFAVAGRLPFGQPFQYRPITNGFCFFQKHYTSRLNFILKLRGRWINGHIIRHVSFQYLYHKRFQKHDTNRLNFIKLRGSCFRWHWLFHVPVPGSPCACFVSSWSLLSVLEALAKPPPPPPPPFFFSPLRRHL